MKLRSCPCRGLKSPVSKGEIHMCNAGLVIVMLVVAFTKNTFKDFFVAAACSFKSTPAFAAYVFAIPNSVFAVIILYFISLSVLVEYIHHKRELSLIPLKYLYIVYWVSFYVIMAQALVYITAIMLS